MFFFAIKNTPKGVFRRLIFIRRLLLHKAVDCRKNVLVNFLVVEFVQNLVTAIFVNFDTYVFHAEVFIHLGKFFDVRRVFTAYGVFLSAENRNGTVFIDFFKIFLFINFGKPVHKAFIKIVRHDVAALFVIAVFFDLFDVARKPCEIVSLFSERLAETSESDFVHELAFLCLALNLRDNARQEFSRADDDAGLTRTAAEDDADRFAFVFKITLTDETAVTVSEVNDGKRVFFGKVFRDVKFVLHGVAVYIARMITDVVFLFGIAVRAVVVRKNYISVCVKEFCKIVVTAGVFRHTVYDLHDAFRHFHVVPDVCLQNRIVERCKFHVFHNSPHSVSYFKTTLIITTYILSLQVIFENSVFFTIAGIYLIEVFMKNKTIVLTGGGSGGHVIPIIALLPEIKREFDKIYFVGGSGIEKTLVKDKDVVYHEIYTTGFDRAHFFKNLKIPFVLAKAVREQIRFFKETKPDVVFSKGGFISLPSVLAAKKLHIPCVAHESDLTLGLANKIAARKGAMILTSFDKTATLSDKFVYSGFPLRKEVAVGSKTAAVEKYNLNTKKKILLVTGGSLGAKTLNDVLEKSLDTLLKDYEIIHVTGKGKNTIKKRQGYHPVEFTNEIGDLYAASDLVVSRAGSGALCEITYLKKPLLLVPLSKAASRGDQLDNAEYAKTFGARVLYEENLTPENFINEIYRTTAPTRPVSCAGNRTITRILTSFVKDEK